MRCDSEIAVNRRAGLPPLSWLARFGRDGVRLDCGARVETFEDGFFEGAWAGPFRERGFAHSENVFGSGGTRETEGWRLITPSHMLEAIYALHDKDGWVAANSLALLLAATGARPIARWPETLALFADIQRGIDYAHQRMPTDAGLVHVIRFHDARLGSSSEPEMVPKPCRPSFVDFSDYETHLENVARAVFENAADPARRGKPFQPLASVSAGYDSPACAVIAARAGCSRGVTIARSRDGKNDDGAEIGSRIGLDMMSAPHPQASGEILADQDRLAGFFATGGQGQDVNLIAFEDILPGSVFVTGYMGGAVWELNEPPNDRLRVGDMAGKSLAEHRLRAGYVHLPLPTIAARRQPSLHVISNSDEMAPWRVGGAYDRPIPRRLVEEAGVPRGAFAVDKKATAVSTGAERTWPAEFSELIHSAPGVSRIGWRRAVGRGLYAVAHAAHGFTRRTAERMPGFIRPHWRRAGRSVARLVFLGRPLAVVSYLHPFQLEVFLWALSRMVPYYKRALRGGPPQGPRPS